MSSGSMALLLGLKKKPGSEEDSEKSDTSSSEGGAFEEAADAAFEAAKADDKPGYRKALEAAVRALIEE